MKYQCETKRGSYNLGESNGNWVGNKVGYEGVHGWVKRHLSRHDKCQECGKEKKLDLANISEEYRRELSDWEWLCRSCHMKKDGRIKKLLKNAHEAIKGKPRSEEFKKMRRERKHTAEK